MHSYDIQCFSSCSFIYLHHIESGKGSHYGFQIKDDKRALTTKCKEMKMIITMIMINELEELEEMDMILRMHSLTRLKYDETETLSRPGRKQ